MLVNRPRATRLLAEAGLDAVVGTSPGNVAYITDGEFVSTRSHPNVLIFAVLPADEAESPAVILPSHEVDPWAEQPGDVTDVTVYGRVYRRLGPKSLSTDDQRIHDLTMSGATHDDGLAALVACLGKRGLLSGAIGVDESHISPPVWDALAAALPGATIRPAAGLLQQIRMVKTEEEITRLRRSAQITAVGMAAVFSAAAPGVSEADLAAVFKAEVSRQGGDAEFWLISGGRRTSHTHTRQTGYELQSGDMLKVDAGCTYSFYWSDLARTKAIGDVTPHQERIYTVMCEAVKAATREVRPGVRASQLFDTAVGHVRDAGIDDYDRHHAGHGIGIEVYDPPMVKAAQRANMFGIADIDPMLEAGVVLNIETPYYELGDFGVIVEDTMVVRAAGAELFAPMSYSLDPRA